MQNRSESRPPATRSRRFTGAAVLAALSAITGVVSYEHGLFVVRAVGNSGLVAFLVPLVPDLMIVGSSLTLIEASALRVRRPLAAVVALVAGIGWTVAMNVAAGWRDGPGAALIAGLIPLAFVLTFESLLWMFRRRPAQTLPDGPGQGEPLDTDVALALLLESGSRRQLAAALGVPRSRVETWARKVAAPPAPQPSLNGSAPHE